VVNPAGSVGTALGAREGFEYTLIPTDVLIAQEPGDVTDASCKYPCLPGEAVPA
jgi:hypothetical protein